MSEQNINPPTEDNPLTHSLDGLKKEILAKTDQMKTIVNNINNDPNDETFNTCFNNMIKYIEQISTAISNNLNFLVGTELFKDDFYKSIDTIGIAIDSYIKSFSSITNPAENSKNINIIKNDIINFSQSLTVFCTNFLETMQDIIQLDQSQKTKEERQIQLNTRLGLESALFNLSVNVQPTDEFPFFKSKFIGVYKCYNTINNITEPISAIQSYCGTGKTSIIPLILMCRSLKDKFTSPFIILTQPLPKHVEAEFKFFTSHVSQYITIITDTDKLFELANNYEKDPKSQDKLVLAILTPHLLLPFLYNIRRNQVFYQSTRIIIDEIHQRTFHLDLLITQIAQLDSKYKVFTIPLNVIFMSASIYSKLLNPFNRKVTVTSLITSSQYEVIERPPIMEHFIDKINNEVVRDEAIKVVEEMAEIDSKIERGHILCFLNLVRVCNSVNDSILSLLKNNEETEKRRKIVFLETKFKSNETVTSFFKRLQNEYTINEELREASKDKYKYDFFYVLPLVFSGIAEESISELVLYEFPGELKKITKLICSTPLSESFNYERLSVVIDSGLIKQPGFDINTGLTTLIETQASKEIMFQRKGRLGRSMKGLYIPIIQNKNIPDIQIPPIQRLDLTANILLMKDIKIDFEKISNLPNVPKKENVNFALNNLKRIKAIEETHLQITPFGHEILAFPFISIYYSAAIIQMKNKSSSNIQNERYFLGAYIATIISMDNLLVTEDLTETLSTFFCQDSDIVTLYEALNHLINSDSDKEKIESFGFSYSNFLQLCDHLQKIANVTHPNTNYKEVIKKITKSKTNVIDIIDLLIKEIEIIDSNWNSIHRIKFNKVKGAGGFKPSPTLIFEANKNLKFKKQRTSMAEVSIIKRPGWNGISIPIDCYCFNINRNMMFQKNNGRLIHRVLNGYHKSIQSIEVRNIALNPWFKVLLSCYIKDDTNQLVPFNENELIHLSNVGGRVFVSFISSYKKNLIHIKNAILKCYEILPYTPNGILIYRSDLNTLLALRLIGTSNYDVFSVDDFHGEYLNKQKIDYCVDNIEYLKNVEPKIFICALFVKKTCKANEYIQNKLFFIQNDFPNLPLIKSITDIEIEQFNEQQKQKKEKKIK